MLSLLDVVVDGINKTFEGKGLQMTYSINEKPSCESPLCLIFLQSPKNNTDIYFDNEMMTEIAISGNSSASFVEVHKLHMLLRKAIDVIKDNQMKSEKFYSFLWSTSSNISQPLQCRYGKSYVDYDASFTGGELKSLKSKNGSLHYRNGGNFMLYSYCGDYVNPLKIAIETCIVYSGICSPTHNLSKLNNLKFDVEYISTELYYYYTNGVLFTCEKAGESLISDVITGCFLSLSILSLVSLIARYLYDSDSCKGPRQGILYISIALLLGQVCFFASAFIDRNTHGTLCLIITIIQHTAWLFYFTLISAFASYLAKQIDKSPASSDNNIFKALVLISTLISMLIVVVSYGCTHLTDEMYLNLDTCWLEVEFILPYFFMVPLAISIFVNTIAFSVTVHKIRTSSIQTDDHFQVSSRVSISKVILKLFLLMGFTWVFGFLANVNSFDWMWHVFVTCNSLQGVYLFLSFGLKKC